MGRYKARTYRGPEHGFQLDFESDYSLKRIGFDDPKLAKKIMSEIRDGRKIWGFQAAVVNSSREQTDQVNRTEEKYAAEMKEAERLGTIDGWPLNPHRYRPDGSVIDGGPEEGIYKGLDCRGMRPGGISGTTIERVPEPLPSDVVMRLNMP